MCSADLDFFTRNSWYVAISKFALNVVKRSILDVLKFSKFLTNHVDSELAFVVCFSFSVTQFLKDLHTLFR